jgi:hypothetical protein
MRKVNHFETRIACVYAVVVADYHSDCVQQMKCLSGLVLFPSNRILWVQGVGLWRYGSLFFV